MKRSDYDLLISTVNDIMFDEEDPEEFAGDCDLTGAQRTAHYVRECIKHDKPMIRSVIRYKLGLDLSGVED